MSELLRPLTVVYLLNFPTARSETGLGMWLFSSPLTCAWDGTTPDKAWRYLQIHLARHDTAKVSHSYAEAVTTRILTRKQPLPVWLVQAELSRFPEGLIRKSLEHGMVEMAMALCTERLKVSPRIALIAEMRLTSSLLCRTPHCRQSSEKAVFNQHIRRSHSWTKWSWLVVTSDTADRLCRHRVVCEL